MTPRPRKRLSPLTKKAALGPHQHFAKAESDCSYGRDCVRGGRVKPGETYMWWFAGPPKAHVHVNCWLAYKKKWPHQLRDQETGQPIS
jgi:hypothetical protein